MLRIEALLSAQDNLPPEFYQTASNLILNDLLPRLNKRGIRIEDSPIKPYDMRVLAYAKFSGELTTRDIREIMDSALEAADAA